MECKEREKNRKSDQANEKPVLEKNIKKVRPKKAGRTLKWRRKIKRVDF